MAEERDPEAVEKVPRLHGVQAAEPLKTTYVPPAQARHVAGERAPTEEE